MNRDSVLVHLVESSGLFRVSRDGRAVDYSNGVAENAIVSTYPRLTDREILEHLQLSFFNSGLQIGRRYRYENGALIVDGYSKPDVLTDKDDFYIGLNTELSRVLIQRAFLSGFSSFIFDIEDVKRDGDFRGNEGKYRLSYTKIKGNDEEKGSWSASMRYQGENPSWLVDAVRRYVNNQVPFIDVDGSRFRPVWRVLQ